MLLQPLRRLQSARDQGDERPIGIRERSAHGDGGDEALCWCEGFVVMSEVHI